MPTSPVPTPASLHQRTNAFARVLTVSSSIVFAVSLIIGLVVMFSGGEPSMNEYGESTSTTNFRGGFLIIVGAVTMWSLLMMLASHFQAITTPAPQETPSQQTPSQQPG
jgi:hypothetical protein